MRQWQALGAKEVKLRVARAHLARVEAALGAAADACGETRAELAKASEAYLRDANAEAGRGPGRGGRRRGRRRRRT
eukprot:4300802-Pyramimonas_sp.AAC.1